MALNIEERLKNSLVVLPPPPEDLEAVGSFTKSALSHKNIILHLIRMKMNGVLVRKQPRAFQSDKSSVSVEQQNVPEDISRGCIYFPSIDSHQVFVIVSAQDIWHEKKAVSETIESAKHHLNCIEDIVSETKSISKLCATKELSVQVFVCLPKKHPASKHFQFLKNSVSNFFQETSFRVTVQANFTDMKSFQKDLDDIQTSSITGSSKLTAALIRYYAASLSRPEEYLISNSSFRMLNFQQSELKEPDKIIDLFNFYFPYRETKLEMIPNFDQLEDNFSCSHRAIDIHANKFMFFYENVVKPLESSSGILINHFTNKHLETIVSVDTLKPEEFEIDWIYLGNEKIVIFDVGASPSPIHPIANKISQCVSSVIPQMLLILHSFLSEFGQPQLKFSNLMESLFKVVVYLPGVTYDNFVREIDLLKEISSAKKDHRSQLMSSVLFPETLFETLQQNWLQIAKFIVFVISDNSDTNRHTKMVQISGELEVVDIFYSVAGLFRSNPPKLATVKRLESAIERKQPSIRRTKSRESLRRNYLDYASAMLTVASLNLYANELSNKTKTFLDFETRFLHSQRENPTSLPKFKLFLTPHQHRILTDSSKTHLVISGQPGTGKTTLLLAKCEQMAQFDEVDKIFFCYPQNRNLFHKQLAKIIETNCSERLKDKLKVQSLVDATKNVLQEGEKTDRATVMIDETIPGTKIDWQFLSGFSCCWISTNNKDFLSEEEIPFNFQHEHLNILFRSASMISTLPQKFLSTQFEKDVLLPGFHARQFRVSVEYATQERLLLGTKKIIEKNCTDRLVVIIMENFLSENVLESIKKTWGATEVVHCFSYDEIASISGAEFQSVLLFAQTNLRGDFLQTVSMAVSRAQFSISIILLMGPEFFCFHLPRELLISTMNDFLLFYEFLFDITRIIVCTDEKYELPFRKRNIKEVDNITTLISEKRQRLDRSIMGMLWECFDLEPLRRNSLPTSSVCKTDDEEALNYFDERAAFEFTTKTFECYDENVAEMEEVTVWDGSQITKKIYVDKISVGRYRSNIVLQGSESKKLTFEFRRQDRFRSPEEIAIYFPCYCILGTKKLFLEFYFPESITRLYGTDTLLTPVLFIYQAAHVPFLRKVKVTLPFDKRVLSTADDLQINYAAPSKHIVVNNNNFEIHSFSFSPAGVTGQELDTPNQTPSQPDNQTSSQLDNQSENSDNHHLEEPDTQTLEESENRTVEERDNQILAESNNQIPEEADIETLEQTVNRTLKEPDNRTLEEPVNRNLEEPVNGNPEQSGSRILGEPDNSTLEEPVNRTQEEPVNWTLDEPDSRALEEPVNRAQEEPVNWTLDEPDSRTLEEPVNQTLGEPINQNLEEPDNQTPEELVNRTLEELVNRILEEPVNSTLIEPVNRTQEEPVRRTLGEPDNRALEEPVTRPLGKPNDQITVERVNPMNLETDKQNAQKPHEQMRQTLSNQVIPLKSDKNSKKWKVLRALNIGDQKWLYDSSAVYFTMDQVVEPWSDNKYILSFNCRSFPLWLEFDPYCWKENLSLHSLSQYSVFKEMTKRQQIKIHIDEVKAPVSICSLNDHLPSVSGECPNVGNPNTIIFENPEGVFANSIIPNQPVFWENNRIDRYYSFHDDNEQFQKPTELCFSFGHQLFKLPFLNKQELSQVKENSPISTDLIKKFLKLLGCNWVMFLTSEFSVPKQYLFEFALMDLRDSVEELLPKSVEELLPKPALGSIAQTKVDFELISIEENLVEKWNDLEAFQLPDQQNRDTKLSILTLCERKFSDLYSDNLKTAKLEIISRVVGEDQDDCGLSDENELILAQHLLTIKSQRLIAEMKIAVDHYEIKGKLTPDLERLLNEQIGGGDDL